MDPFASSVGGSSKRGRTPSGGTQAVSCLVDGCNSDLSKCRDYHRRHKVCEVHSKTPRVTIAGHHQRFCQQCSRFHSLGEFDEGKRSCRKRLEGHNRRRRKPQPESLPVNHPNFPSATQGSRYFSLSNQPIIPTANAVVNTNTTTTTWCGAVKNENPTGFYSSSSSISASYIDGYKPNQFSFVGSSSTSAHHIFQHHPNKNNNGALSLLSSSPTADTCEMGLGPSITNPTPLNPTRPMISELQYNNNMLPYLGSLRQGLEYQPGTNMTNNHSLCQNVYTGEADDGSSSARGGNQTISFSWE